jgi:hypothetical protein
MGLKILTAKFKRKKKGKAVKKDKFQGKKREIICPADLFFIFPKNLSILRFYAVILCSPKKIIVSFLPLTNKPLRS